MPITSKTVSFWLTLRERTTGEMVSFLFGPGGICVVMPVCDVDGEFLYTNLANATGKTWMVDNYLGDIACLDNLHFGAD